jgi:hypothetical protein
MGKADVITDSDFTQIPGLGESCWRSLRRIAVKGQGQGQTLAQFSAQALLYAV